jgi:hypothetical protein
MASAVPVSPSAPWYYLVVDNDESTKAGRQYIINFLRSELRAKDFRLEQPLDGSDFNLSVIAHGNDTDDDILAFADPDRPEPVHVTRTGIMNDLAMGYPKSRITVHPCVCFNANGSSSSVAPGNNIYWFPLTFYAQYGGPYIDHIQRFLQTGGTQVSEERGEVSNSRILSRLQQDAELKGSTK